MYNFDVEKATNGCINWIREWFLKNGKDCNAVLGISGGKDSSVVAALCVAALGKDRVIGVLMPQGVQSDIDYSIELCEFLGIRNYTVNVGAAVSAITDEIAASMEITDQAKFNLPARVRMATVYAVAQSQNGRVANTCNLSEDWVGYSTRFKFHSSGGYRHRKLPRSTRKIRQKAANRRTLRPNRRGQARLYLRNS